MQEQTITNTLFIDTHNYMAFGIAFDDGQKYKYIMAQDASSKLLASLKALNLKQEINEIIIIKGPGSLTGLRIGSSSALGIALGIKMRTKKDIIIKSLTIWDILLNEYDNLTIFFYTGTKKWIIKTKETEIITENIENIPFSSWMSNNEAKTPNLPQHNKITYPNLIELMPKYKHLATSDLDLLYPVNLF
jgi:hypothetical protein